MSGAGSPAVGGIGVPWQMCRKRSREFAHIMAQWGDGCLQSYFQGRPGPSENNLRYHNESGAALIIIAGPGPG